MSKTDDINVKIKTLNDYLSWFESDEFDLEQALVKYDEAKKLADEIQIQLDQLKNKINVVTKQFDKD